ncbi:MAG TPA: response regulator transcription factor [Verrucomicrobiae bacterium]
MANKHQRCVILADRHHGLTEGVRGLLETMFDTVIMVADEASLLGGASRLEPTAVIADLSLARADNLGWLRQLRISCPKTKLIVLSVHDEPSVCARALEAGADGFVFKRAIATDLLPGLDVVMRGKQYVSSALRPRSSGSSQEPTHSS